MRKLLVATVGLLGLAASGSSALNPADAWDKTKAGATRSVAIKPDECAAKGCKELRELGGNAVQPPEVSPVGKAAAAAAGGKTESRQKQAVRLWKQIQSFDYAYGVLKAPVISDAEYDQLKQKLRQLPYPPPAPGFIPSSPQQEAAYLREQILYHDYRYSVLKAPAICDADYDQLRKNLRLLEATHPEARELPSAHDYGIDAPGRDR